MHSEVYEVDEEMLKKIDELEEYPEYYDREIQEIRMEKNDEVEKCWLYLMRNCPDHLLQKPLLKYEYCSIPTTVAQNSLINQGLSLKSIEKEEIELITI
uniref:Gamma-glutamylcyclotransferase family protein n=1 Tax=Glossina palpalis gambiensis TaxID=67801 RepID=A0A1B0BUE4_9MUSC